jgi:predicted RNase H-like HicB family nuclease
MAKAVYKLYTEHPSDGDIFAFIPNLPGCHFKGTHLATILKTARTRIKAHLEAFIQAGKRIPPNSPLSFHVWDISVNLPVALSRRRKGKITYKLFTQSRRNGQTFAFVPNLLGCESDGRSLEAAVQKAKLSIESSLKAFVEAGEEIPANPIIGIHELNINVSRPTSRSSRTTISPGAQR